MVQAAFTVLYIAQAVTLAYGDSKPTHTQVSGNQGAAGGAILAVENDRYAFLTFVDLRSEFHWVTEFIGTRGRITLEEPGHCPTALTVRIPPVTPSRYMNGNTPSPLQRFEYPLPGSIRMPRPFTN